MRKKVLIVRLDAIGDYIFFRNSLRFIRNSVRYRDAHITVLGNPAWRSIAETFDKDCADEWIWLANKSLYFKTSAENLLPECIWHARVRRKQAKLREELKALQFDEVISPQVTRERLFDELLGGLAPATIGVKHAGGTDSIYTELLDPGKHPFEFYGNRSVASELTGQPCAIPFELAVPCKAGPERKIIFNIGASHWMRRWPITHWAALGRALLASTDCSIMVTGGKGDITRANKLARDLHSERASSMAGQSLINYIDHAATAWKVVSNDTGLLHIAAALGTSCVSVVDGNTGRDQFWPYPDEMGANLHVCWPPLIRPPTGLLPCRQLACYRNICDIEPKSVLAALLAP